ncbi:MAG: hypothetical protein M1296_04590 [Chloroflexi bacterium]|nr:hypothetical protein [Chloroflexota bacterium]
MTAFLTDSLAPPPAYPDDAVVLAELVTLVQETYTLWDEDWVGFSWRAYTHDHVRRVRNLAMVLARRAGGDQRPLDFGATLHDVTKSYDGEILMENGKRIVDEHGFWRNAYLPPRRSNKVTQLYEALNLRGELHNVSGARIADTLLAERGYPEHFRAHVVEIIASHLHVTAETSLEGRCLYDADTIDANIGLPALYRNIHITMHNLEREHRTRGQSLDDYLRESFRSFFEPYVREKLPAWIAGKDRDFVDRLTTGAGKSVARERIARLSVTVAHTQSELPQLEEAVNSGVSGILHFFAHERQNPSLSTDLERVHERYARCSATASSVVEAFYRECFGLW